MHEKIIILGCGYSGMITALAFAREGKEVVVIERRDTTAGDFFIDVRTTALNSFSKSYFAKLGIWDAFSEHVGTMREIYVADNNEPGMICFGGIDTEDTGKAEAPGYVIENPLFKKILLEKIQAEANIKLLDCSEYTDIENTTEGCELLLNNGEKIAARLVIACDGRNAPAATKFFRQEVNKSYDQYAITFHVEHEKEHEGTAVERFMPGGPFAILPLKHPRRASVVWTRPTAQGKALQHISREELTFLVREHFGPFLGKVDIVGNVAYFPLRAYVTEKYFNKSLVLLADTAHVIHPLAGQGLNQGIKDIAALIEQIRNLGINTTALQNYENARKADNLLMFEITDGLNRIFKGNSVIFRKMRGLGFKAVEKLRPLKKLLLGHASGL